MIINKNEVVMEIKKEDAMEIKKEDVSDILRPMVEIVGMEDFIEISKVYGGDLLYIPSYKSLKKQSRNRKIKMAYDGFNARELSQIYQLSVSQIHRIARSEI